MTTKTLEITEKEAAAYFNNLFNSNIIPMATWKYDGTFTSVNDAFLQLIGYSRQEFEAGKVNWKKLTPSEYVNQDEKRIQDMKNSGECKPFTKEYICKDGSKVRIKIHNVLLNKSDDHGLGIFLKA